MRFLIDADLPRSVSDVVRSYGHEAVDVRDVGLGTAQDQEIALYAQMEKLCLLTGDYDFSNIRNYPPSNYSGIVVLHIPRNTTSDYIVALVDSFFQNDSLLQQLPGKLAIVEAGQVRMRGDR